MSQSICIDALTSVTGIDQLREELQKHLDVPVLEIKVGEPTKIDVSALQLLGSFVLAQKAKGHRVDWLDVSTFFLESAKLSGFSNVLGLEEG